MKRLIFLFAFVIATSAVVGQSRYYMRYDSVYFERGGGNSEFILRNGTRDSTGGLLTNVWKGRTAFMKTRLLNDSTIVIGLDTFVIRGKPLITSTHIPFGDTDNRMTDDADLTYTASNNRLNTGTGNFADSLLVGRLRDGTTSDSIVVWDNITKALKKVLGSSLITASNGLTKSGNNITLGGLLTGSTFIEGEQNLFAVTNTSTLTLQSILASDANKYSQITLEPSGTLLIRQNLNSNRRADFLMTNQTITLAIDYDLATFINVFKLDTTFTYHNTKLGIIDDGLSSLTDAQIQSTLHVYGDASINVTPPGTGTDSVLVKGVNNKIYAVAQSSVGGGGGGSVTNFVFTDGSGFDGTVTSSTSTPTLALTTSLTAGSVPIIGASGALTEDNANFFFDNTNNRLGLGTNVPTHPVTLQQTNAFAGMALYKTTDQTTNYGRGIIKMRTSGTVPVLEFDAQNGGTVSAGYHSFQVNGVEKLAVDAAQATFSGNFFFSPDATHDIGRLSGSPFRPRNLYLSGSAQFGAPANTSIARQLHVVTQNAVTNAITNVARFAHMTSGTAAAGSGVGIEFEAENASGTQIITSSITNPYTTATAGSETAELALNVIRSGSSSERLRLGQYLSTPTGTTSRSARHGGVVWNTISTVSTSGTSETDLHTRTTEASVLAADGEWIEWKSIGILNPGNTENGATITIRAYWAGTEVFETAATAPAAAVPYTITVRVQRMSSSSAMVTTEISGGGFSITLVSPAIVNVTTTFSNTNILKVTGETTDADQALNAITSDIKWFPTNQ